MNHLFWLDHLHADDDKELLRCILPYHSEFDPTDDGREVVRAIVGVPHRDIAELTCVLGHDGKLEMAEIWAGHRDSASASENADAMVEHLSKRFAPLAEHVAADAFAYPADEGRLDNIKSMGCWLRPDGNVVQVLTCVVPAAEPYVTPAYTHARLFLVDGTPADSDAGVVSQ